MCSDKHHECCTGPFNVKILLAKVINANILDSDDRVGFPDVARQDARTTGPVMMMLISNISPAMKRFVAILY